MSQLILSDFIDKVQGVELSEFQKAFIRRLESGEKINFVVPILSGKTMLKRMLEDYRAVMNDKQEQKRDR